MRKLKVPSGIYAHRRRNRQSDQGFRRELTESFDTINISTEGKCPDENLRMRRMNIYLSILRMLVDTDSLDVAHLCLQENIGCGYSLESHQ